MKVLAPAKINLFLEVGEKKEKFHPIVSLITPISFSDIVEIEKSKKTEIIFHSKWEIPVDNTVKKTLDLLETKFKTDIPVKIDIWKRIPPGSGLGGGSSNAAVVLENVIQMFNLDISEKEMLKIALNIGSDVPFFIYKNLSIVSGYGEIVKPVKNYIPTYYFLLLVPPIRISTKDVYEQLDKKREFGNLTNGLKKIKILVGLLREREFEKAESIMYNRLEKPCFEIWEEGKEVMKEIEKMSGRKFFLSGSGGSLFSIFREKREAETIKLGDVAVGWDFFIIECFNNSKIKEEINGNNRNQNFARYESE